MPASRLAFFYTLTPPTRWRMGSIGEDTIYLDCGRCHAVGPPIAAFQGTSPDYSGMLLLRTSEPGSYRTASYCEACAPVVEAELQARPGSIVYPEE